MGFYQSAPPISCFIDICQCNNKETRDLKRKSPLMCFGDFAVPQCSLCPHNESCTYAAWLFHLFHLVCIVGGGYCYLKQVPLLGHIMVPAFCLVIIEFLFLFWFCWYFLFSPLISRIPSLSFPSSVLSPRSGSPVTLIMFSVSASSFLCVHICLLVITCLLWWLVLSRTFFLFEFLLLY